MEQFFEDEGIRQYVEISKSYDNTGAWAFATPWLSKNFVQPATCRAIWTGCKSV